MGGSGLVVHPDSDLHRPFLAEHVHVCIFRDGEQQEARWRLHGIPSASAMRRPLISPEAPSGKLSIASTFRQLEPQTQIRFGSILLKNSARKFRSSDLQNAPTSIWPLFFWRNQRSGLNSWICLQASKRSNS